MRQNENQRSIERKYEALKAVVENFIGNLEADHELMYEQSLLITQASEKGYPAESAVIVSRILSEASSLRVEVKKIDNVEDGVPA